jgi:hypothetical protein
MTDIVTKMEYEILGEGPYLHLFAKEPFDKQQLIKSCKDGDIQIYFVPGPIDSKTNLLSSIGKALLFPAYYGMNWDAFEECLNDLTWLESKRNCLVLENADDLTKLPIKEMETFLLLIFDAIQSWLKDEGQLHIAFVCSSPIANQIGDRVADLWATRG